MQHPQQLPPRATSLGAVVLFLGFAAPSWTGCAASARHPFPEIAREEAGYLEPGVPPGATCDRVQVNGAQLHYIDHGGTGPTMIFLAGLGNSAHIWDEFAPRFTDQCHVYAFTRRGFGESDQPDGGYDTCRLAEDVIALMDALQLTRATLVGHSVAGDELSEIGVRFPDRIDRLIYLDAAYDRSHGTRRLLVALLANQLPPAPPKPDREDRASVASFRAYLERIYGVEWPADEVLATRFFAPDGRFAQDVTSGSINLKVVRGESAPDYAKIQAPVLAIYSTDRGIEQDVPWTRTLGIGRGVAELKARRACAAQGRWERGERRRLARALPTARIVEIPRASHYVFLSHPEQVEAEIRRHLRS
ncbi:MAG: alpha/beta hydrolase, partial [Candidatus Eisenbacteria bacterium]|nr:alpha/beta hydrolase [Candidatus Eisenbacteria bacterium]